MLKKVLFLAILSLIITVTGFNMCALADSDVIELIKPISDIKTVNKSIIISGWADMGTVIDIKVFFKEVVNIGGIYVDKWTDSTQQGVENKITVGQTGFFAKEIELKYGVTKVVIKAVKSGKEEVIEGEVTLSSKDELKEAVKNLINFNFIDIIKKLIQ